MSKERKCNIKYFDKSKEAALVSKIFFPLAEYLERRDPSQTKFKCLFATNSWLLRLVVFILDLQRGFFNGPKSDASWWIYDFPRLLVEVFSLGSRDDLTSFLLQDASCVRLANILLHQENKPMEFVLPLVYVDQDFVAHRYILFQDTKTSSGSSGTV